MTFFYYIKLLKNNHNTFIIDVLIIVNTIYDTDIMIKPRNDF